VPGPGTYSISSKVGEGPLYSIKGKYRGPKGSEVPVIPRKGPGSYEPKLSSHVYESSPQYRIGTAQRSTDNRYDSPGPGAYDSNQRGNGPQWGFGSQSRDDLHGNQAVPGPGSYQIPNPRDPKAFTMTARHKEAANYANPGPGAYSPSKSLDAPLYSMGRGKRDSKLDSAAPGPGAYDVNGKFAPTTSVRIGTGTRRPLSASSSHPGPGNYEIPVKSIEGPSWSMRPKTAQHRSSEAPVRPR
jgi:hypothetical protein